MVPVFCRKTWSLRTDGRMHLRPQHLCLWQERQLWFDTEQGPYILQKGSIQTPPSPKWAAAILFPTLNVHLRCDLYLFPEHSEGSIKIPISVLPKSLHLLLFIRKGKSALDACVGELKLQKTILKINIILKRKCSSDAVRSDRVWN